MTTNELRVAGLGRELVLRLDNEDNTQIHVEIYVRDTGRRLGHVWTHPARCFLWRSTSTRLRLLFCGDSCVDLDDEHEAQQVEQWLEDFTADTRTARKPLNAETLMNDRPLSILDGSEDDR